MNPGYDSTGEVALITAGAVAMTDIDSDTLGAAVDRLTGDGHQALS